MIQRVYPRLPRPSWMQQGYVAGAIFLLGMLAGFGIDNWFDGRAEYIFLWAGQNCVVGG